MRRSLFVSLSAIAIAAATVAIGAAPASAAPRSTLRDSRPAWATPAARRAAAHAADRMQFRVYLQMRDRAGAEATARAVSDPASPSYRKFLTPAQVRDRFAPTAASVAAVQSWLAGQGLRPGYVPPNNQFVEATGTVDKVQRAFGTTLGVYAVRGKTLRAPDTELSVPASLASTIQAVIGTDQSMSLLKPNAIAVDPDTPTPPVPGSATTSAAPVSPSSAPPPSGFRNARPCSAYWGEAVDTTDPAYDGYPSPLPYAPCGYVPRQLRQVYGVQQLVDQGLDGRSTTVAIVDAFASPTIFKDASTYAKRNDPQFPLRSSQFSQLVFPANHDLEGPNQCDASGWYGEESLDVEAVHGMAPGANILYVGSSDCQDPSIDKALNEIVSKKLAQIISNSYGNLGEDIPGDEVGAFENIAVQAVLQGIGVYFSSGDSGDEGTNLDQPSPDFPASSPWVTAVGGTSLGIGDDGQRVLETGWETGRSVLTDGAWTPPAPGQYLYGSGGGTSRLFRQPWYQRDVVPDTLSTRNQPEGRKGRTVPDISMVGDPNTGMLIGLTQRFPGETRYDEYRIGGTSLSAPLFAGVMALADDINGQPNGFVNPTLYQRVQGTAGILDITHKKAADVRVDFVNGVNRYAGYRTSVRTFDYDGLTIRTSPGYDRVTGLGVPNGRQFLFRL
ncbi:MAG: S8/S53 family peptidase [Actinobacteria bacterium]|nr:S8/S53 family peptidase [Actinomycetota bacterium]